MSVSVQPHNYEPLQRFFNRGRCRACLLHEREHIPGRFYPDWPPARAWGEKTEALTWADVYGTSTVIVRSRPHEALA
jgi:hypothetical protein